MIVICHKLINVVFPTMKELDVILKGRKYIDKGYSKNRQQHVTCVMKNVKKIPRINNSEIIVK